ncbi:MULTISPECIES: ParA family protein [Leptospira]|uniref:Chromosome partitioning protein ParA n=2 Tax=Leptospira kirschneri TaxID=29507 RepID=A0A1T1E0V5_9LEPT|nr:MULTISPECIES: ParA family protein [Leptospira]EMO75577.1 YhjQ protein [Leptospira kirschneri str. 200801925]EJO69534.1 YhjQ protein [Leptospira kirschneri serovar Grippotyphosa str. RM52]EKO49970.1 YhjQ protein [Leptospira kirschneri str. 200802841]EKP06272.1 YhjQ protein [Leptospira kirschneri str. 2008720114]EKQ85076.1 YhjQ protein [Leptospira kirschneri serovar Grippotyphosa str. Moskva]
MKQILCIANQKGGVGKTTTAVHLAFGLALKKERVILLDLDAQGNATSVFIEENSHSLHTEEGREKSLYKIFRDGGDLREVLIPTRIQDLRIAPSHPSIAEVDVMLSGKINGFFQLRDSLESIKDDFDYVIVDCPPSLSMITLNAFVASTGLLVPLQVSKFSLDGIEAILEAHKNTVKRFNPSLKVLGAVLTMFNPRTTLSQTLEPMIEPYLKLFSSRIPPSVSVEEAHMMKQTLFEYQPKGKAAKSYQSFVEEVLELG